MRSARLVLSQSLAWSLLVVTAAGALAAVLTAVDGGGGLGPTRGLAVGGLRVPGLLVVLLPLLCGLAAGLASARQLARGERRALELAGLAPWRVAAPGLLVGLLVGLSGFVVHDRVVPETESLADVLGEGGEAPWVFLDGRAIRVADGLVVELANDAISDVRRLPEGELDRPRIRDAAARQQPTRAPARVLWSSSTSTARAELAARVARVLAAGLLAFLGWLPLARTPAAQVGTALAAGMAWAGWDALLAAAVAQGRVGATIGGGGSVLLACVFVVGAVAWCRRVRTSAFTAP